MTKSQRKFIDWVLLTMEELQSTTQSKDIIVEINSPIGKRCANLKVWLKYITNYKNNTNGNPSQKKSTELLLNAILNKSFEKTAHNKKLADHKFEIEPSQH